MPHREIGEAVGVEVPLGDREAEQVDRLGIALGEQLVGPCQPAGAAIEDVDSTGQGRPPNSLTGDADGQVVEAVAVEVDPGGTVGRGRLGSRADHGVGWTPGHRPRDRQQRRQRHRNDAERSSHPDHPLPPSQAASMKWSP